MRSFGRPAREPDLADAEFDAFVRESYSRLVRAAIAMLGGSREEAEDIVQEALIRVYRRWESICSPSAAPSYAYTAVSRLARRRRTRIRRTLPLDAPHADKSTLDESYLSEPLIAALAKLSPRQRQTLVLRFVADLSVEDTANVMGCSASTVKSQCREGIERLRRDLTSGQPIQD